MGFTPLFLDQPRTGGVIAILIASAVPRAGWFEIGCCEVNVVDDVNSPIGITAPHATLAEPSTNRAPPRPMEINLYTGGWRREKILRELSAMAVEVRKQNWRV